MGSRLKKGWTSDEVYCYRVAKEALNVSRYYGYRIMACNFVNLQHLHTIDGHSLSLVLANGTSFVHTFSAAQKIVFFLIIRSKQKFFNYLNCFKFENNRINNSEMKEKKTIFVIIKWTGKKIHLTLWVEPFKKIYNKNRVMSHWNGSEN